MSVNAVHLLVVFCIVTCNYRYSILSIPFPKASRYKVQVLDDISLTTSHNNKSFRREGKKMKNDRTVYIACQQ